MLKKTHLKIACIQLNAGANWEKNWQATEKLLLAAARAQPDLILLPENFIARVPEQKIISVAREAVPQILLLLRTFAKRHSVVIVAGSVPELLKQFRRKQKILTANTCYVFSAQGKQILKYRKMHLFDIDIPGVRVQESRSVLAGKKPGFFKVQGMGVGVGICYDLRFPEYFRALSKRGAELFLIPANFTAQTGKTAWEVLLRARAIENQCYVAAAGQCGRHPASGIVSYGHSMVLDPEGKVMKRASFGKSKVLIEVIKAGDLCVLRHRFPVLKHRKINA